MLDIGLLQRLDPEVSDLLGDISTAIILPRYRSLAPGEMHEKAPDELVTSADYESEELLRKVLPALLPGSRVLGEEACSLDPSLLDGVASGLVWLVDPLDGTRNFVSGSPHFAIMVALVDEGETIASWIHHPLTNMCYHAFRGLGAFVNGEPFHGRTTSRHGLTGALPARYAPRDGAAALARVADCAETILPGLMCAGIDYPRCVDGTQDFAVFWRSLPWDHAPGALFVGEAGGFVGWSDGTPYRVADQSPGLIAAATPEIWSAVARIMATTSSAGSPDSLACRGAPS